MDVAFILDKYFKGMTVLRILIADDGMGIRASLAENEKFKDITEPEALRLCMEDTVTDGKGMGFRLYTISRLVNSIGKEFILHSGRHKLIIKGRNSESHPNLLERLRVGVQSPGMDGRVVTELDNVKDGQTSVIENGLWQGTLIYMEIGTGEEIDPNQIVDHRANAAEEYNETFVETGELESLW